MKKVSKRLQFARSNKALRRYHHFLPLINKHGPIKALQGSHPFKALARSIMYQQLSGKAAGTIFRRFVELFKRGKSGTGASFGKSKAGNGRSFPTPQEVRAMPIALLRTAGLSGQKASYIHDLAEKFSKDNRGNARFRAMSNQAILDQLLEIKGVGEWTVHMFLIFTLNRPDVLPVGDLGIRKGFQIVYKLKSLPDPETMERLAKPWRAHATVASGYLWLAADERKG